MYQLVLMTAAMRLHTKATVANQTHCGLSPVPLLALMVLRRDLVPLPKLPVASLGVKPSDSLKHLDERCVHFAPVQAIGRNDARVITVIAIDLLLRAEWR